MWPGQQQPPGGEPNPQDAHQNPYQQQPGTPNPYQQQPPTAAYGEQQQPGYGYPQQPPAPQGWGQQPPTVPVPQWGGTPPPPPPRGGSPFSTRTVAIVAASAVVVAAAATGAFVLTRDDKGADLADGKPSSSPSAPASSAAPSPGASSANPRGGADAKPVIPGWKVVINPKHGTAFDVPPDWEVKSSGLSIGFEDHAKKDGTPLVMMGAPAILKEDWCKVDADKDGKEESTELAGIGTKGGMGAKDTAEAAYNEAGNWAFSAYAQKGPKGTTKIVAAKEYTTSSGLKGHMATASVSGLPKENKCATDGKSVAFSFTTAKGDIASWVLYGVAGVPGEVSKETYEKILSSVRLHTD
ncbi:hypothetical protein [Streptomyces sp. TBY4]|uniref:hypothetical protein n=1 Tax=Streptomyces sp. TBY4 TaxID=2962030 RepID=UPI0020B7E376|nr:hypothetical protein [Streptomyces sp. TBY4]MCP3759726.1 hypothetical protein [Streptomyces sp. TBY4]